MAIEPNISLWMGPCGKKSLQLENTDEIKYPGFEMPLGDGQEILIDKAKPQWWNYFLCGMKGIAEALNLSTWPMTGLGCLVHGTIPPASGLSSSSALVVAASLATLHLAKAMDSYTRSQLADLCARSERFIGTQGGGMDQGKICTSHLEKGPIF